MLHVDDQRDDACEDEHERRIEGDARHPAGPVAVIGDGSQRQQRVDERGNEQPDGELARFVPKDPLHDPRRELAHRELNDDHGDGQDECGQADHGGGNRCQHCAGGRRRPDEAWRKRLVAPVPVEGERPAGDRGPRQHAEDRNQPETGAGTNDHVRGLHPAPHAPSASSVNHEPSKSPRLNVLESV